MGQERLVPQIMQMITGGWTAGAIAVFASIGAADELAGGKASAEALAKKLSLHERSLYRLLRFIASIGLVRELPGKTFELTEAGNLLRKDVPGNLRDVAIFFVSSHAQRPWEEAEHSIRTGKPSFDRMYGASAWDWYASHPAESRVFQNAMTALAGTLHKAAVQAYDFSGIGTIMDLGGGHGHLLAQILAKHPSMKGILLDLPNVVKDAGATFSRLGVADRARAVGGSFFEKLPEGADAHIMAHIIHDWDDEHCVKILSNCRAAIAPGGRLLVVDAVLTGPNEPDFAKLLDLEMLLVPAGQERTGAEFEALFARGGWKLTRIVPTAAGKSVIEGRPA